MNLWTESFCNLRVAGGNFQRGFTGELEEIRLPGGGDNGREEVVPGYRDHSFEEAA